MEQWQFLPEMKGSMVSLMRVLNRLVEHKGIEAEEEEDIGLAFLRDISKLVLCSCQSETMNGILPLKMRDSS